MKAVRRLSRDGIPEEEVRRELQQAYDMDSHFTENHILYSMCNKPPKLAVDAHVQFIEANLGDPNLYRGTQILEKSVVNMLLSVLSGDVSMGGKVLEGGTEANITAIWIYRNLTGKKEIVVPQTGHYSFETAADMLNMKLKRVPVDDSVRVDVQELEKLVDPEKTAAVVAIAGTTEHGQLDPIHRVQKVCADRGVPLHVDAAFGGLVFPFLEKLGYELENEFDFALEGVTSITVDPHKMGHSTPPAGALLLRDPEMFKHISHNTFYLSTEHLSSILGTRCSAGVASAYAVLRHYGWHGYYPIVKECMEMTQWFAGALKDIGVSLAIEPVSPVICVRMPDEEKARNVQSRLLAGGWRISRTRTPPGIRFVMMPHVKKGELTDFLPEFRDVCQREDVVR